MTTTPFDLLSLENQQTIHAALQQRRVKSQRLRADAGRFVASAALQEAINTAIAVGEPLLLSGDPGTGKTQTAYYVAERLVLGEVLHFQVKSDSKAQDVLYTFDSVRYFHDAHLQSQVTLNKSNYVDDGPLLTALCPREADSQRRVATRHPRVLLIDEIDKAARDFPNDLLHELDQMSFSIRETGEQIVADQANRPLVFITSNSERRLPDAFLRRCVFHHIELDKDLLRQALAAHQDEFLGLAKVDGLLETALNRFWVLFSNHSLRKRPATGELLVWLRVMALHSGSSAEKLQALYARLQDEQQSVPFLGAMLKDRQDLEKVR